MPPTAQEAVRLARKIIPDHSPDTMRKLVLPLFDVACRLVRSLPTIEAQQALHAAVGAWGLVSLVESWTGAAERSDACVAVKEAADQVAEVMTKRGSKPEAMRD